MVGPDSSNEYPQSSLHGWFMQEEGEEGFHLLLFGFP